MTGKWPERNFAATQIPTPWTLTNSGKSERIWQDLTTFSGGVSFHQRKAEPDDQVKRQTMMMQELLPLAKNVVGDSWKDWGVTEENAMAVMMQVQMMAMMSPELQPKAAKVMNFFQGQVGAWAHQIFVSGTKNFTTWQAQRPPSATKRILADRKSVV